MRGVTLRASLREVCDEVARATSYAASKGIEPVSMPHGDVPGAPERDTACYEVDYPLLAAWAEGVAAEVAADFAGVVESIKVSGKTLTIKLKPMGLLPCHADEANRAFRAALVGGLMARWYAMLGDSRAEECRRDADTLMSTLRTVVYRRSGLVRPC